MAVGIFNGQKDGHEVCIATVPDVGNRWCAIGFRATGGRFEVDLVRGGVPVDCRFFVIGYFEYVVATCERECPIWS